MPSDLSDAERRARLAMAGREVVGASVRVVDANIRDVPRDRKTIGEVIVMGDQMMDGYFGEPDATRAAMSGPWLHTGDMAVWDEDGYIQIVDRKKQIIISGGENISSLEVEKAIFAHPAVLECAVVAAPDPKWGEVPAAIVVLKDGDVAHPRRTARLPRAAPEQVQIAPDRRVFERSSPQDRNRQDPQERAPRAILGWNGKCQAGSGLMVFVRLENYDDLVTLRLWEAGTLGITEGDGLHGRVLRGCGSRFAIRCAGGCC